MRSAPSPPENWWPIDPTLDRDDYVARVLEALRNTPSTAGRIRPGDRQLALHLFDQGVPLSAVKAAFSLAAARRIFRHPAAPPLSPVRSLHYFLPVIREILTTPIDPDYIAYLDWKLQHLEEIRRQELYKLGFDPELDMQELRPRR